MKKSPKPPISWSPSHNKTEIGTRCFWISPLTQTIPLPESLCYPWPQGTTTSQRLSHCSRRVQCFGRACLCVSTPRPTNLHCCPRSRNWLKRCSIPWIQVKEPSSLSPRSEERRVGKERNVHLSPLSITVTAIR